MKDIFVVVRDQDMVICSFVDPDRANEFVEILNSRNCVDPINPFNTEGLKPYSIKQIPLYD